jgi:hypothetical protein
MYVARCIVVSCLATRANLTYLIDGLMDESRLDPPQFVHKTAPELLTAREELIHGTTECAC